MKWSKAFIPTLKEDPKEAESASHKLLLRGGFVRQHQSGVYIFLPLGWKIMLKIINIVREEMNRIGAQEMLLPSLTASELWEESGRWESFGSDMFRLKDRKDKDMALAPTHEEIMADIARNSIRSYRDLPQIWYQIQTKFRDEPRPRSGILRVREFIMKDSYSFDTSWEGLDESYEKHREAYIRIFKRSGLRFRVVRASSGLMGGSASEEFMVPSPAGEDVLAVCDNCGYAANLEVAKGIPDPIPESPFKKREKVHTPDVKSVEEVSAFLKVSPSLIVKSLVYMVGDDPYLVLIRGDHDVNEAKLSSAFGGEVRLAEPGEVMDLFGVQVGFVGPIGIKAKGIIADLALKGGRGMVVGANEEDHHIVGVNLEEDIEISRFEDIRSVKEGDKCENCGSPLRIEKAIEVGHIFKLGTRYSESMGVYYTAQDGSRKPIIMGSYGIGIGRIMAAACEIYHDEKGISWPINIAPYEVVLLEIDHRKTGDRAGELYEDLLKRGVDVIWDDRDAGAGFKFKDAELIGIPIIAVISERKLKEGKLEIQFRRDGQSMDVNFDEAGAAIAEIVRELKEKDAGRT
ncbi:MAG TPA: proline--tRNA ligase [candidate division WOR-3 bacterium]|uniref:Proline--tRNA ligase n=1 Tax=candidate division WOR-3 bacterium TaxID=2052148 RepID=A0A7C0X9J0_UNCW3|nr:proline--tRNA ligase [candidate division WOR-3 bacterium]